MKNREKILAAFGFLVAVATAFSSELASLIRSADGDPKVRLTRHTVYVRKNATNASSTWRIIDENTKKVDGVSTIGENRLPKNQVVVFDKIAVGFAEGDAAGKEGALAYNQEAPSSLRNANLVITQNGREVVDLPVADLIAGETTHTSGDAYHDLEGFNYLVDDQAMEWNFRFPNGETLAPSAAGKVAYVEVRLQGFKTSRKQ